MNKNHIQQLIGALGFVFLISVFLTFLVIRPNFIQTFAKKLLPAPDNLTELYFEDVPDLPKDASSGAEISFAFSLHNIEHKEMIYPINIYVEDDNSVPTTSLVATDKVTLSDGEKKTLQESFVFPEVHTRRSKITVKLINKNQTIDFWTNLPPSATISAEISPENE